MWYTFSLIFPSENSFIVFHHNVSEYCVPHLALYIIVFYSYKTLMHIWCMLTRILTTSWAIFLSNQVVKRGVLSYRFWHFTITSEKHQAPTEAPNSISFPPMHEGHLELSVIVIVNKGGNLVFDNFDFKLTSTQYDWRASYMYIV